MVAEVTGGQFDGHPQVATSAVGPRGRSAPFASPPARGPWRVERDGFSQVALAGTPEEMGAQHGELLRQEIQDLLSAIYHHVLNGRQRKTLGWLTRRALRTSARLMETRIPPRYRREMAALAQAANVTYRDILLLNCLDDVLANLWVPGSFFARWACSGFATWGTASPTGELFCGRNLDYYVWSADGDDPWAATSYMKEHVVAVTYQPTSNPAFVSIGWPGFIGCPTSLNSRGISISALTVATRRNWPFATPATFIYRDIMESAATLDEAVLILRRAARSQGNNVLLGSGAEGRAVVVEFTPWQLAVREPTADAITVTNHFLHPDTAKGSEVVSEGSQVRMQRMDQLSCQLDGRESAMQCLLDTLQPAEAPTVDFSIYNPCTIYSVLFEPAQGRGWVRTADGPQRAFQGVMLP